MDVAGFQKSFVIDQGAVLGMDQLFQALFHKPLSDPKRQGICTGLSMIWLARLMMWHDESPKQRFSALHSAGAYRWGGKTQDIHLSAGGGGGGDMYNELEGMYGEALKAYVLRIVRNQIAFSDYTDSKTTAQAMNAVVAKTGAYCLYNVGLKTNSGDAGHMVASYMSHGTLGLRRHYYFFDPNMGEYRIDAGDVTKFLGLWLDAYARDFQGINYLVAFEVRRG